MDYSENPLWEEALSLLNDDQQPIIHRWRIEVMLGDEILEPSRLDAISVKRQYNVNFGDEIYVTCHMAAGDYHRRMIPNREDLKLAMYKEPLAPVTNDTLLDEDVVRRVYRVLILNPSSAALEATHQGLSDDEVSNEMPPVQVELQLIDPALEELRMISSCGIYRNMRPHEVIQGTLTLAAGQLELDADESLRGVDVVPGNNQDVRTHTVIPYGTRVRDIPRLMQEEIAGVYSAGLGHYIQNGLWYVYPKYNLNRFEETPNNLTVVNLPEKRLPGAEKTYRKDGDQVLVLGTGKTRHIDNSEDKQLNQGNAVRFAHAQTFVDAFRQVQANRVTIDRASNLAELVVKPRRTGLNLTRVSPRRITANPYREVSELAERVGSFIQIEWQNADPDLIYPGMPVRYLYADNDTLESIEGLVLGADYVVQMVSQGLVETKYACTVILTLYVHALNPK